jgi:hypothetical protein
MLFMILPPMQRQKLHLNCGYPTNVKLDIEAKVVDHPTNVKLGIATIVLFE